jgi:thiol-disulfide isomerase/thioredoxin
VGLTGLTLTLAWSLLATLACTPGLSAQEVALPVGSAGPNPALEDLDGNPVHLMDFIQEGKPALIEFWASWCEQCEALQPQMDEVEARFGSRLSVVAVAVAVAQSQRRVKRYVEEHGHDYPFLWDGDGDAVRSYQVPGTSVVVLLDAAGTVAYTGTGPGQDLVAAVTKVLKGQTLPLIPPAPASPHRWRP